MIQWSAISMFVHYKNCYYFSISLYSSLPLFFFPNRIFFFFWFLILACCRRAGVQSRGNGGGRGQEACLPDNQGHRFLPCQQRKFLSSNQSRASRCVSQSETIFAYESGFLPVRAEITLCQPIRNNLCIRSWVCSNQSRDYFVAANQRQVLDIKFNAANH